jgi:hypothetical protein
MVCGGGAGAAGPRQIVGGEDIFDLLKNIINKSVRNLLHSESYQLL